MWHAGKYFYKVFIGCLLFIQMRCLYCFEMPCLYTAKWFYFGIILANRTYKTHILKKRIGEIARHRRDIIEFVCSCSSKCQYLSTTRIAEKFSFSFVEHKMLQISVFDLRLTFKKVGGIRYTSESVRPALNVDPPELLLHLA